MSYMYVRTSYFRIFVATYVIANCFTVRKELLYISRDARGYAGPDSNCVYIRQILTFCVKLLYTYVCTHFILCCKLIKKSTSYVIGLSLKVLLEAKVIFKICMD